MQLELAGTDEQVNKVSESNARLIKVILYLDISLYYSMCCVPTFETDSEWFAKLSYCCYFYGD